MFKNRENVLEIDGHQESEIVDATNQAQKVTNKPSLIIAKSTIGIVKHIAPKFSPSS